jgi:pimeloyl-ACP methyl ester carboxylesterase
VAGLASRVGLHPAPVIVELWRSYSSLGDEDTRRAFLLTLRAVIDRGGQAVSAANRLHLAAEVPTLIVWGGADPIIPVEHAHEAHAMIAGSRLDIFDGVGHYPHVEAPERFAALLIDFIETTAPAQITISPHHVLGAASA